MIFAPFVVWNAEHGWATFAKQLGRAGPSEFTPYYLAEFIVAQIGLINPLVVAALVPAVAAIPWRAPVMPRSPDEARRILACTIAPAAVYFLLHSLHDRVQGNWLAPLYPACAILAADWIAEIRRSASFRLRRRNRESGSMGGANRDCRRRADLRRGHRPAPCRSGRPIRSRASKGFRELARDLDAKARADDAPYVLTRATR